MSTTKRCSNRLQAKVVINIESIIFFFSSSFISQLIHRLHSIVAKKKWERILHAVGRASLVSFWAKKMNWNQVKMPVELTTISKVSKDFKSKDYTSRVSDKQAWLFTRWIPLTNTFLNSSNSVKFDMICPWDVSFIPDWERKGQAQHEKSTCMTLLKRFLRANRRPWCLLDTFTRKVIKRRKSEWTFTWSRGKAWRWSVYRIRSLAMETLCLERLKPSSPSRIVAFAFLFCFPHYSYQSLHDDVSPSVFVGTRGGFMFIYRSLILHFFSFFL